jgi:hypothetical protein
MLRNNLLHEMARQQVFPEAHGVPDYDGRRTVRPLVASPRPGSKFATFLWVMMNDALKVKRARPAQRKNSESLPTDTVP